MVGGTARFVNYYALSPHLSRIRPRFATAENRQVPLAQRSECNRMSGSGAPSQAVDVPLDHGVKWFPPIVSTAEVLSIDRLCSTE